MVSCEWFSLCKIVEFYEWLMRKISCDTLGPGRSPRVLSQLYDILDYNGMKSKLKTRDGFKVG